MAEPPPHLAAALDGAGWHPAAWRLPAARPGEPLLPNRALPSGDGAPHGTLRARLGLPPIHSRQDGAP
ncbi:hypothetical protein ABT297_11840 [Dactylosporangium sp. NPDC000555]|uniref:hypothetical protein n=1 Tax=Dactylosporangium sp. NPDC000555 TaxID=3154260 RepID=UPI00331784A6